MTGDLTNLDRARTAGTALVAFRRAASMQGEDLPTIWRDLVGDLLHLADMWGMDREAELQKAQAMAEEERREEISGMPEGTARFLRLADLLASIEREGGGVRWNTERIPAIDAALGLLPDIFGFAWGSPIHHGTIYLLSVRGEKPPECGKFPETVREAFRSIRHGAGAARYWHENMKPGGWTYTDHWGAQRLICTIAERLRDNLLGLPVR